MGYDKPDLGYVVHYQAPSSIISYYQQVGRAGRAIDRAIGLLMTGLKMTTFTPFSGVMHSPPHDRVERILNALSRSDGLSIRQLEQALNLRYGQISTVLKYLSVDNPAPVRKHGYKWLRTPVRYGWIMNTLTGSRDNGR